MSVSSGLMAPDRGSYNSAGDDAGTDDNDPETSSQQFTIEAPDRQSTDRPYTRQDLGCSANSLLAGQPTTEGSHFTWRSVVVGLFIGIIICFSNTYFGLQTGWVSGLVRITDTAATAESRC